LCSAKNRYILNNGAKRPAQSPSPIVWITESSPSLSLFSGALASRPQHVFVFFGRGEKVLITIIETMVHRLRNAAATHVLQRTSYVAYAATTTKAALPA
jgi:hypothetical protein